MSPLEKEVARLARKFAEADAAEANATQAAAQLVGQMHVASVAFAAAEQASVSIADARAVEAAEAAGAV
eukprot:8075-Lingulodinium_polyedra.AAC.1